MGHSFFSNMTGHGFLTRAPYHAVPGLSVTWLTLPVFSTQLTGRSQCGGTDVVDTMPFRGARASCWPPRLLQGMRLLAASGRATATDLKGPCYGTWLL
jgi:hypothetical protein